MAELATLARPYAEAMFQVTQAQDAGIAAAWVAQLEALAQLSTDERVLALASHPEVRTEQLLEWIVSLAQAAKVPPLVAPVKELLALLLENGRLAVLPELVAQLARLHDERAGVAQAFVDSAFVLSPEQLAQLQPGLERRFKRRLKLQQRLVPELIAGVRVVVGDEVFDTSVQARLDHMKAALLA